MAKYIAPKKVVAPRLDLTKFQQKEPTKTTYDPLKQVEGYEKRLEASGIDPEKATDKRSWLERALNLEEDQNTLFDIFEVLERPQQALFGAIKAGQEGGNAGKAAWEHFKGNEHTYGKDILLETGGFDDSGDKFGVDDALGLVMDVFVDPIDLALIPATGGAKLAADAAQVVKRGEAMLDIAKAANKADEISAAVKFLDKAKLVEQGAKKVKLRTIRDLTFQGVKKGFKKGFSVTDQALSNVLKKIDDLNIKKLGKAQALGHEEAVKAFHALDGYKDFKKYLVGIFDPIKRLPKNAWNRVFKINSAEMLSQKEAMALQELMIKKIDAYAAKVGMSSEQAGIDIMFGIEAFRYTPRGSYIKFIQNPSQALDDEAFDAIQPLFKITGFDGNDIYKKVPISGRKEGYVVQNPTAHKKFIEALGEDSDVKKALNELAGIDSKGRSWETRVKSNLGSNYLSKAGVKLPKEARQAFYDDVISTATRWIDGDKVLTSQQKRAELLELFNKHGLTKYIDDSTLNFDSFTKYLDKRTTGRRMYLQFDNEETLLPRFFDDKRYNDIKNLYENDEAFKTIVDESYDFKVAIEETYARVYNDIVGGKNIEINTIEGIIPHVETKEMAAMRKVSNLFPDDELKAPILRGRRSLVSGRDYRVSAEEANAIYQAQVDLFIKNGTIKDDQLDFFRNHENMQLFKTDIQSSVADMIEKRPRLTKDAKLMEDFLATSWLEDPDLIRNFTPSDPMKLSYQKNTIPIGYSKVNRADLINELKGYEKLMPEGSSITKLREALEKNFTGVEVVLENNIYEMIKAFTDDNKGQYFLKFVDWVNSIFKKTKLLSPGFQIRNFMGNAFNMYAAGVPINDVMLNYGKAHKIISEGEAVFKKLSQGIELTVEEQKIWKWYKPFVANNFHEISNKLFKTSTEAADKMVDEIAKLDGVAKKAKQPFKWLVNKNSAMNQFNDERFRLALFMYASENPELLSKFGVVNPEDLVRKVLFDPADLSWAEKTRLRKVIPFYTFTKKNLVYQMENFGINSKRYQAVQKSIRDTWRAMELNPQEDVEQYKTEDFWLPVPFVDKNGEYRAIRAKLPIEDLGELIENPLRKFVAASAPLIRAPYEYTANKQLFTQMPISEFEGQRGYMIPEISRKAEYLLSQTGLDIPVAGVADIGRTGYQAVTGQLADKNFGEKLEQGLGRSVVSRGSAEKAQRSRAYDRLNQIRDLMKYYKQEGVTIMRLSDLENNKTDMLARLSEKMQRIAQQYNK